MRKIQLLGLDWELNLYSFEPSEALYQLGTEAITESFHGYEFCIYNLITA